MTETVHTDVVGQPNGRNPFLPLLPADNEVPVRQRGQWSLLWRRFRRHRLAVLGARILLFMIALAAVGPWIAPPFRIDSAVSLSSFAAQGHPPQLWPLDLRTIMGTDILGNAVSAYVLSGARATLVIGILGSLVAALVGSMIGGISGYFGGIVDAFLMRVVDALLTVPFLPLLMVLVLYLPDRGMFMYILLFGVTGWAAVARLVRSSVLSLREREFAEAARALGVSDLGVIGRHMLPNTLDILIVAFTLNVAVFVLAEAALDYLGAGPIDMTWGKALARAGSILELQWWMIVFPGAGLLLTVLSVNFLGDGLRDALDIAGSSSMPIVPYGAEDGRDGPFVRGMAWTARQIGSGVGALRRLATQISAQAHTRFHPSARQRAEPVHAGRLSGITGRLDAHSSASTRHGPLWTIAQSAPIAAILLILGTAFLYGHSPLRYSPYYGPPTVEAGLGGQYDYGAVPAARGKWSLLYIDTASRLVFKGTDSAGNDIIRTLVPHAADVSGPSLAMRGRNGLAAWVASGNQVVRAAFVGRHPSPAFALNPSGGQVEHPYAVALPNGNDDILFQWGKPGAKSIYDIYLATMRVGLPHPFSVRLIARGVPYALYPRAAIDGSGALDVIYMERVIPGEWHWIFRRFTVAGDPIGKPRVLDTVHYYEVMQSGAINAEVNPPRWGADIQRAPDGSVWAAWGGDRTASVAHWGPTGRSLLPPTVAIPAGMEAPSDVRAVRSLALAVTRRGLILYHQFPGEEESYMGALGVNVHGHATTPEPERVAYDGGGAAVDPHAGVGGGGPMVIWQKVRSGTAALEGTAYHPAQPPDLLTHLGLNIGNVWANIGVVILGALTLGVGITAINLGPILVLALLRLAAGRVVPGRYAWPAYVVLLAIVFIWFFALSASPPPFVLFTLTLPWPYTWAMAAGAILASWWVGRTLFRRQETAFRAMSMATVGFYVPAVLYAVLFIEGQLGRI